MNPCPNGLPPREKCEAWAAAEGGPAAENTALADGEVVMPGGHMTVAQLAVMRNTIPAEISFIDTENTNRYFNEGPNVFKRPGMALDWDVFSCHPPKIEPMVHAIIEAFRAGRRDRLPVWVEKDGHIMLVNHMAVRDSTGKYLGTMEFDQDSPQASICGASLSRAGNEGLHPSLPLHRPETSYPR